MAKTLVISLNILLSVFLGQSALSAQSAHRHRQDTLKILFLGDIMQHQSQLDAAYTTGPKNDPGSYDYSSYYEHLKEYFDRADLICANMETNFAPPPYSGYPVFASPSSLASQSFDKGINIFLAANNHICDKGAKGLKGSVELFDSIGVFHAGLYRNEEEEYMRHPLNIKTGDFKIAFLNYTYGTNGFAVPDPYIVKILDSTTIKKDLAKAVMVNPDRIIVCVHWGPEYSLGTSASQKKWEDFFYRYGADMVIGSHPHVPQEVTYVEESDSFGSKRASRITAFSLGNAISNMSVENTRIGIMLEVNIVKDRHGNTSTLPPKAHYIWTARPNSTAKNYSIIPIEKFLKNPSDYPCADDYDKVKYFYNRFNK